jgi:hypothetical protein
VTERKRDREREKERQREIERVKRIRKKENNAVWPTLPAHAMLAFAN